MKTTKVTTHNIMFTQTMAWDGQNSDLNLGLILGKKRNYIIDTGLGSDSVAPILEYIDHDTKPIVVVNTHSCFDHIWGNWVFENSLIISHILCRDSILEDWDHVIQTYNEHINGEARRCLPNLAFEKNLYFPEDSIEIFHTPGHTPGCISVYDAVDKVLYAGDNIGDTDDEIVPAIWTDLTTFQRLIEVYKEYDFKFCISGHNKPQTKEVLTRMEDALPEAWGKQNNKE